MSTLVRRLHAAGGVLLGGYACFHLYVQLAALQGRDAWLERVQRHRLGVALGALIVLTIFGHAAIGVWRWYEYRKAVRAGQAEPEALQPRVGFQLVTGVLLAGFVVCHLAQVWPPAHGPHASLLASYQTLWSSMGRPVLLVTYVVGVTALAFHFGSGLLRLARGTLGSRHALGVAALFGVVLWLGYLQVVARFAIGEGLIPTGSTTGPRDAAPEDDGAALDH